MPDRWTPETRLAVVRGFAATVVVAYALWAIAFRLTTDDPAADWRPSKAGLPTLVNRVSAQQLEGIPGVPEVVLAAALPDLLLKPVPVESLDLIPIEVPRGGAADAGFGVVVRVSEFEPGQRLSVAGETGSLVLRHRSASGELYGESAGEDGRATGARLLPWVQPEPALPIEITIAQRDDTTTVWVDRSFFGTFPIGAPEAVSAEGWRPDQVLGVWVGPVKP